jgi:DNA repair exonuclease SbcCD ATPase subunit
MISQSELVEARQLIEENEKLARELQERREEAQHNRVAFLRTEQALLTQLKQHQQDKHTASARVSAKTAELKRLQAACKLHKDEIARMENAAEQRNQTLPNSTSLDTEGFSVAMPAETVNLSRLNRDLKQALALNQQLRDELERESSAINQKGSEFRGLLGVLNEDQDTEDDGITEDRQEEIIQDSFRALEAYKCANWSNQTEYRNAALGLIRDIERVVCLQTLKAERRRKLRHRIDTIQRSVVSCKSALVQLLNNQ